MYINEIKLLMFRSAESTDVSFKHHCFLLARAGEDDDRPVVVLVSKGLNQVDQVGVLHLLWSQDVPLVQLFHRPGSADKHFMPNYFR